ncbi:hypothetical protein T484DRAFT_1830434 [Baffinella frigidus]|nr:hypothetical protein T484DRAFT_1830434 [Cryptophyta sp. CCMP2293]
MQVRALVLALAVFLAVLPGSVGKDAERELYPDPRKHPASCGRQGLTTSLVCDPSSILAQDESDRVDVVARHLHPVPWSVRDDGMIVGVALVKQTGLLAY